MKDSGEDENIFVSKLCNLIFTKYILTHDREKIENLWYMQYQVSRRLHIQPTACVATPHTLVYRNTRIIAQTARPPPVHTRGKQSSSSSGSGRATHRHNRTVARQHNRMQGRFMMSTQYNYAGIDIAKRNFVIAVSSLSKTKTETNKHERYRPYRRIP